MDVTIVPKGGEVALKGKNTVRTAIVGLGWDTNAGQSSADFDLDASLLARDAAGTALDVCYYGRLDIGWAKHSGDNLTGAGDGDDEQITVVLGDVPSEVVRLDVVVHIYEGGKRGQSFGMVEHAYARVLNDNGDEIVNTKLSDDPDAFDATGVHIASIVREGGPTWKFVAAHTFGPQNATLTASKDTLLPV